MSGPGEQRPDELLRAWRSAAVPVAEHDEAQCQRMTSAMRSVISAEARRVQRRARIVRWASLCAAAAVVVGVGLASWKLGLNMGERSAAVQESTELAISASRGGVVFQRGTATRLLEPHKAASLGAGDKLETLTDGRAELDTDHSRWLLGSATRVELVGAGRTGERLRLVHGTVDVDVRHARDRNVIVDTPHAEVMVVGTAFSVSVEGAGGSARTLVRVSRGTVWILQGGEQRAVVNAGQEWSSQADAESKLEATAPSASPSSAVLGPAVQGSLAEENRLFRAALDARNRGEHAAAAELFAEHLRRFPRALMSEEASIGRLRALLHLGRAREAAVEARRYLARFPSGQAREEAQRVLDGS